MSLLAKIPSLVFSRQFLLVIIFFVLLTFYGMIRVSITKRTECMTEDIIRDKDFLEANCGENIAQAYRWRLVHLCEERMHAMHHPINDRATTEVLDEYGFPGWMTWTLFDYTAYLLVVLFIVSLIAFSQYLNKHERLWRQDMFPRAMGVDPTRKKN